MDSDRVDKALARIEAAAARIEAAARAVPPGDAELAMKHAQLKGSVAASLRELDLLIGTLER